MLLSLIAVSALLTATFVGNPPCNSCTDYERDIVFVMELTQDDEISLKGAAGESQSHQLAKAMLQNLDLGLNKTRIAVVAYDSNTAWVVSDFYQNGIAESYYERALGNLALIDSDDHAKSLTQESVPGTALNTVGKLMKAHIEWSSETSKQYPNSEIRTKSSKSTVRLSTISTQNHIGAAVVSDTLPVRGRYTFDVKFEVLSAGSVIWPSDFFVGVLLDGPFSPLQPNASLDADNVVGFYSDGGAKVGSTSQEMDGRFDFKPSDEKIMQGKIHHKTTFEVDLNMMEITIVKWNIWEFRRTLPLRTTPTRIVCNIPLGPVLDAEVTLFSSEDFGFRGNSRPAIIIENQWSRSQHDVSVQETLEILRNYNPDVYSFSPVTPAAGSPVASLQYGAGTTSVFSSFDNSLASLPILIENHVCAMNSNGCDSALQFNDLATSTLTTTPTTTVYKPSTTATTTATASETTTTLTTTLSSTASSTGSTTLSTTLTSSLTSTGSTSLTSSLTSSATSTASTSDTSTLSTTLSSTASTTKSTTLTSSLTSTGSSTATTTLTSSASTTYTSSATTSLTSSASSTDTTTLTSTASITPSTTLTTTNTETPEVCGFPGYDCSRGDVLPKDTCEHAQDQGLCTSETEKSWQIMCPFTCCCQHTYAPTDSPSTSAPSPPPPPPSECDCSAKDIWDSSMCSAVVNKSLCDEPGWMDFCMASCCSQVCNPVPTGAPTKAPTTRAPTRPFETFSPTPSPTQPPTCPPVVHPPENGCLDKSGKKSKLKLLVLTYTGNNIVSHQQGSRVSIEGQPDFASPVRVVVKNKDSVISIFNTVEIGGSITLRQSKWPAYTTIEIIARANSKLPSGQSPPYDSKLGYDDSTSSEGGSTNYKLSVIKFHTSCSVCIKLGNSFGSLEVIGIQNQAGVHYGDQTSNAILNSCEICSRNNKDKIKVLELLWNSNFRKSAFVVADGSQSSKLNVAHGESVRLDASASKKGVFEANTDITVTTKRSQTVSLHTSCSQPLRLGRVLTYKFGTLTVIGFETAYGRTESNCFDSQGCPVPYGKPSNSICNACVESDGGKAKLRSIMLQYTGSNSLSTSQDADKSTVSGIPNFANPVTIAVRSPKDEDFSYNFEDVHIGNSVTITPMDKFPSETVVYIVSQGNSIVNVLGMGMGKSGMGKSGMGKSGKGGSTPTLEDLAPLGTISSILFHTSCSVPIAVGDSFGSIRIVGALNDEINLDSACDTSGNLFVLSDSEPSTKCDLCSYLGSQHLSSLSFVYTGNYIIDNYQSASIVAGSASFKDTVHISVKFDDDDTIVQMIDSLNLGDTLNVTFETGSTTVTTVTVEIISSDDLQHPEVLEHIRLDIGCNQPLGLGQSFGSLRLIDYKFESGIQNEIANECLEPKSIAGESSLCNGCANGATLTSLTIRYTGDTRIMHNQVNSLDAVLGDARYISPVSIQVLLKTVEGDDMSSEEQILNIGEEFDFPIEDESVSVVLVIAATTSSQYLSSDVRTVPDAGTILSTIEILTDCVDPVSIGDSFGSVDIVGFTNSEGVSSASMAPECLQNSEQALYQCRNVFDDAFCDALASENRCNNMDFRSQCWKSCGHCVPSALPPMTCENVKNQLGASAEVWWKDLSSHSICGTSRDLHGQCFSNDDTFTSASLACSDDGLRLCTHTELLAGAAGSTGCAFNKEMIWSSTPCQYSSTEIGAYIVAGNAVFKSNPANYCESLHAQHGTRCCADSSVAQSVGSPQEPQGDNDDSKNAGSVVAAIMCIAILAIGLAVVVFKKRKMGQATLTRTTSTSDASESQTTWDDAYSVVGIKSPDLETKM